MFLQGNFSCSFTLKKHEKKLKMSPLPSKERNDNSYHNTKWLKVYQINSNNYERNIYEQTLILSASIDVLAIRMRAFSILFGWLIPTFLSSKNPAKNIQKRDHGVVLLSKIQSPINYFTKYTFIQLC